MSNNTPAVSEYLESIQRLTRDLRNAAITLSDREARYLVDAYYASQRDRIRAAHQERTLAQGSEPHDIVSWLSGQRETLENQIRRALAGYAGANPVGVWCQSIVGIGPVITAGLLANIDIKQAPTVGHIWRFAGLDPTDKWNKGEKRPWNGSLKRLCWLIGESFVKVSGNENDVYGKVYKVRKELENERNDALRFSDQAKASLEAKKFGADTEARKHYEQGKLPPARIHLRAERYATKLFLSHLHCVWYWHEFRKPPPKPFVLSLPNHTHFVAPPNCEMFPGLEAALAAAVSAQSTDAHETTSHEFRPTSPADNRESSASSDRPAAKGEGAKPVEPPKKRGKRAA